jgi:folate-dependent tRNA-U54 methylase TrmFO/GidA
MNVNYGLFPPLADATRRKGRRDRNERMAQRALERLAPYAAHVASLVA